MTRARDVANVLSTATALATDAETAAAISSHNSATTSVHGISNTANLATAASVSSSISTHNTAANGHVGRGNTASRPASPATGDLYYDTTINNLIRYNGSAWIEISPIPNSPTSVSASLTGTQATVSFTAPTNTLVSSYTATSSTGNLTASSSSSPITISGLSTGTTYTFSVTATNVNGTSAASSSSNSVTPVVPGSTWTTRNFATSAGYTYPIYANGVYLVTIQDVQNRILRSTDGVNWTTINPSVGNSLQYWHGVGYGNGKFIISDRTQSGVNNNIAYSTNGSTWTIASTSPNGYGGNRIGWNGTRFALAFNASNTIAYSTDGASWTAGATPYSGNYGWGNIAAGNGKFVVIQDGGAGPVNYSGTSNDGITWTQRTMTATAQRWRGVIYDGSGKWVAVARSNNAGAYSTDDGASWTATTLPTGTWTDVTYGDGYFIAVGWTSIATSPDGITWTARTSPITTDGEGIAYGPNGAIAVQYGTTTYATTY